MINKLSLFFLLLCFSAFVFAQSYQEIIKSAETELTNGSKSNAASLFNKAGYKAWDAKDYDVAKSAFERSLELNLESGNLNAIKVMYSNIGDIHMDKKELQNARKAYNTGLDFFSKKGNISGQCNFLKKLGEVEFDAKSYDQSIDFLTQALDLAHQAKDENNIRNCNRLLSESYKAAGNTQKSFEHFENYRALLTKMQKEQQSHIQTKAQEQIASATTQKALLQAENDKIAAEQALTKVSLTQTKDSLEKVDARSKLQQEHIEKLQVEKELSELQDQNRQLIIDIIIIVLVFVVGFTIYAIIMLRRTRSKNNKLKIQQTEILKQNQEIAAKTEELEGAYGEIHEKNHKIESSINYAQRIQESMLPEEGRLEKFFEEHFIIFRPKDVVSGDFYWFDNPRTGLGEVRRDRNRLAITAVDCTGHGVPGAFMSMLGFNALQNINGAGINQSDLMLNELHNRIRYNILKQDKTNNKDGMDMALCIVDKEKRQIQFTGAHNPFVFIQNGELTQIKGNKFPIGGVQREDERIFTLNVIDIPEPTYCYIFSDGFQDQFGGPQGRKFMVKRMKQMFLDNHLKPFEEQRKIYQCALDQWMNQDGKTYKQIDDILVIGFKI